MSSCIAAAILVVLKPVAGESSIIPSATPRKTRHAIMFVKPANTVVIMKCSDVGINGDTITAKLAKKKTMTALETQTEIKR